MRTNRSASALYLAGPTSSTGSTWRILTADDAVFEIQYGSAAALLVRRVEGVHSDRRPRRLVAFEAEVYEPLRFTAEGNRERVEAVVASITRVRPYCRKCGERLLAGVCNRCLVDPTHYYAETKYAGKPQSRRRLLVYRLEPLLRLLDGR